MTLITHFCDGLPGLAIAACDSALAAGLLTGWSWRNQGLAFRSFADLAVARSAKETGWIEGTRFHGAAAHLKMGVLCIEKIDSSMP